MSTSDIIEVSSEGEVLPKLTTVFRNGKVWKHFERWEDAMRFAYPGWEPWTPTDHAALLER